MLVDGLWRGLRRSHRVKDLDGIAARGIDAHLPEARIAQQLLQPRGLRIAGDARAAKCSATSNPALGPTNRAHAALSSRTVRRDEEFARLPVTGARIDQVLQYFSRRHDIEMFRRKGRVFQFAFVYFKTHITHVLDGAGGNVESLRVPTILACSRKQISRAATDVQQTIVFAVGENSPVISSNLVCTNCGGESASSFT